jgi:hypothetical protein
MCPILTVRVAGSGSEGQGSEDLVDRRGHRAGLRLLAGPGVERDLEHEHTEFGQDGGLQRRLAAFDEGAPGSTDQVGALPCVPVAELVVALDDPAPGRCLGVVAVEARGGDLLQHTADDLHRLEVGGRLGDEPRSVGRDLVAGEDDLALVGEVPEERPGGQAGTCGDLRHGRGGEALLGEEFEGRALESSSCIRSPSHRSIVPDDTTCHEGL